jgi:hypothetical protein
VAQITVQPWQAGSGRPKPACALVAGRCLTTLLVNQPRPLHLDHHHSWTSLPPLLLFSPYPAAAHPSIATICTHTASTVPPRLRGHERLPAPAPETLASVRAGHSTSRERPEHRQDIYTRSTPGIYTPTTHHSSAGDLGSPTPGGGQQCYSEEVYRSQCRWHFHGA